ncbi:serine--tRNA ligase, mitochondrial [Aricia agestis]|uniref:serine--tRNA ligase, mitochondrial n=1 Tax=Aricia agestis TaxID=91739 RepID=UPI001C206DE5|nr:serine--tRNA ligase, mitochondrial [Aricia agestis]
MFKSSLYKIVYNNCKRLKVSKFYSDSCMFEIDTTYYCNKDNEKEIKHNIEIRKGVGNIRKVLEVYEELKDVKISDKKYQPLREQLHFELEKLPNKTHPLVTGYKEDPVVIHTINSKRTFSKEPFEFSEITEKLNIMRTDKLGITCGNRSYCYLGELAEVEEALIKYTVSKLLKKNYLLISVPDILPHAVLKGCGMSPNSNRTQIYALDPTLHGPDLYLSGTAEMSLAGLLMNSIHEIKKLPLKLAAVSRCYRAETSSVVEERGTYRVHQFTKVEMFTVTTPDHSDQMLEEVRKTQEELFTELGLYMRVLDMPPHELGAPAYRKYDIEAWMPGRKNFGEISSCSNCTDYQSRRLNIKYIDGNTKSFVHTLNGTACAIPRMLIALVETHQDTKGMARIAIPKVLQPYLNGKEYIGKNKSIPKLKILKLKK